ncbi:MAG TPA: S8 family serine peptidase [Euzebya sp.]|nr:S8 family serine peptidase [Euzebya sp.]
MDVMRDLGRPVADALTWDVGVRQRRMQAAVVALVMALAVTAAPGLFMAGTTTSHSYVLDVGAVLPAGARVVRSLPFIDAIVVDSPVAIPGAASMDTPVRPETLEFDTGTPGGLDSAVGGSRAPEVWATGELGRQAVVALVDTGVADVPALDGAVAGEVDFTGTGGGDGYGHGTFMASIIAGRGAVAPGVAPEAGILSLKVADAAGATTLGTVLSALEWLHGPGRSAGIRISMLAMAVEPGTQAARFLDRAVDRLARRGVLVVTAAGNDGADQLTSPATAPRSFSVGAFDDGGTAAAGDDTLATFSGTGPDTAGVAQPDAMASGINVVGSLPPGSVIAAEGAQSIGDGLYMGSGTSMATAVAAGVAALASSARPDLDGQELDAALRAGGGDVDAVDSLAAVLAAPVDRRGNAGSAGGNGNGSGSGNGSGNGNGNGNDPASPQSVRWTSVRWTSVRWTGAGWGDMQWGVSAWGSVRWTGAAWAYNGVTPQSVRWTSLRWTSIRWTEHP